MEHIISLIWTTMQCIATLFFFDAFFEHLHPLKKFLSISLLWILLSFIVMNCLGPLSSEKKLLLIPLLYWVAGLLLYKGSHLMHLVIALVYHALFTALSDLILFAAASFTNSSFLVFLFDTPYYLLTGTLQSLSILLFSFLIRKFHVPISYHGQDKKWTILTAFFPFSSIMTVFLLYCATLGITSNIWLTMVCILFLLISNLIVLLIMESIQKNIRDHEALLAVNERIRAQEQTLNALESAYSAQRKLTHDFRRHLGVMTAFLQQNETTSALEYLKQLNQQQTERILLVNSHHAAIDAVLNQKAYTAKKEGIDIQFEVNDLSALKIQSIDCTVVLGNLLDNATEACLKLPTNIRRWIQVSVVLTPATDFTEPSLFISVLNPSLPVNIVNDTIATTKPDPTLHGFGLRTVKDVLNRYGAEHVMSYQDGCFLFSIEWPDFSINCSER